MKLKTLLPIFFSIVFVTAIVGGWFYWYQWRPTEIRKECAKEREDYIENRFPEIEPTIDEGIKLINLKYDRCLSEKGLKG